ASVVTNPKIGVTLIPAVSSSILVALTSAASRLLYLMSLLAPLPRMIVYAMPPSSIQSLTPVIVTVCAIFQLAAVKVTDATFVVPSTVLLFLFPIITPATRWSVNFPYTTLFRSASVVTNPKIGVTLIPAVSSSKLVALTSAASRLLYLMSLLAPRSEERRVGKRA